MIKNKVLSLITIFMIVVSQMQYLAFAVSGDAIIETPPITPTEEIPLEEFEIEIPGTEIIEEEIEVVQTTEPNEEQNTPEEIDEINTEESNESENVETEIVEDDLDTIDETETVEDDLVAIDETVNENTDQEDKEQIIEQIVEDPFNEEVPIEEVVETEILIEEIIEQESLENSEPENEQLVLLEDIRAEQLAEQNDQEELIEQPEIELEKTLEEVIEENQGECARSTVGCEVIFQEENNLVEVTLYETDEEDSENIEDSDEVIIDGTLYETGETDDNQIIINDQIELIENSSKAKEDEDENKSENEDDNTTLTSKRKEKRGNDGFMMAGDQELVAKKKNVEQKIKTVQAKSSIGSNIDINELNKQESKRRREEAKQATVLFKKETQIISTQGVIQRFEDIQFEQDILDESPYKEKPVLGSVLVGSDQDHLIFSTPVEVIIPVSEIDVEPGETVQVSSLHYGEEKYTISSLSTDSNAVCLPDGTISNPNNEATVYDGQVIVYTCGASTFVVTYVGGANFDNFVDNASLPKTITVGAGGSITDLNVIVDFQPIDSEDPTAFGATNAYSNEVSMTIESPDGTTISLLNAGTYNNNGAANRAEVTFDDAAGAAPTNLPVDGTFLPSAVLSAFNGEDPIGDWTFTLSDNTGGDGVILFEVSLELSDASVCNDSVIEGAEGCDDGGNANGDGCNATCLIEDTFACNTSGSGAENDFGCASGVCDQTEVTPTCEAANTCGNGTVEGAEECDDGNTTDGDGCSSSCVLVFCENGVIDPAANDGIILSEDFEGANGTTQTSSTTFITQPTYSLLYENTGANGQLRYGSDAVQANGGAGAMTLDVTPTGTFVTNQVTLEVDLSAYAANDDLTFSFDRSDHGDEDQPEDIVEMRGSDTDTFFQILDFNPNVAANGTYKTETFDIDGLLTANGQTVSSTFQIRFGQNDNFTANNANANDGISIDNILITETAVVGPLLAEQCDDGNGLAGDGCDSSCQIESPYTCTGEPSVCTTCGDGIINGSDTCDDGNQDSGDGCDSSCQIETDYICSGAPSVCTQCTTEDIIKGTVISSVGPATQTINFADFTSHTYASTPVVIMTPVTDTNTNNYSIPVISNVTTTSVTISSCVDAGDVTCDATLNDDDFALFVVDVDKAACTDHIEAGTTVIDTDGTDTAFTFADIFTNAPYVFTTPQTYTQGGNIAATAWVDDNALSVNGGDFVGCVHQNGNDVPTNGSVDICEAGQPDETLGRVAVDPTLFAMTGFQLGTQNISNSTWTPVTFTPSYGQPPAVMVTQNSDNGGQDPQYAWARNTTDSGTEIRYCEADAGGVCHSHTSEIVRWFSVDVVLCGNGEITTGEACDDGNTTSGDGCSDVCVIESGYVCTGEPSVCTLGSGCGDGTVDVGEECDDGNTTNSDGCSDICELENPLLCGDGDLNPGETCDDSNTTNGDGCSDTCQVEAGFICPDNALCGNNTIDAGEQCDDGNTTDGDGCSQYCIDEFNFLLANFTGESLIRTPAPGGGLADPIWSIDPTGYEATVLPGANPYATAFYAPFNFWSLAAPRAIELAFQGASDDDFIGYVFGFQPGDWENPAADFLLVTWKDIDQTFDFADDPIGGGQADAGLSIIRVQGEVSYDELRQHIDSPNTTGSVTELARGTTYGNVGYRPDLYDTSVFYNTGSMDVYVNGALDISITGNFQDGRFGIFILAQAGNTFALGRPHPYALGGGCYALCGDGIIAGDEVCDDGNTTNGDGCSEFCADEAVDECALGTDNCSINATCYDSYEGFDCICNTGYTGDGVTCSNGSNSPPTDMVLSGSTIEENNLTGAVIGTLTTTDPDPDTFTYTFGCAAPLPDEAFFSLSGDQLLAGTGFNFEIPFDDNTDNDYEICVLVDDNNGGTYEETFTITVTDAYEEVCITVGTGMVFNPVTATSASGGVIASQTFSGWFNVQDYNGSNTGWFTTLSISGFTGSLGATMPATIAEIRNVNPIRTVSGTANPNITFDGAMSAYQPFTTPVTYLQRPVGTNNGVTGEYETDPEIRLTIPPYQQVDTYSATITYTLFEN